MFLKIDCKMYFDCSSEGHFRRKFCSSGTYWNHRDKKCDEIQNVPECVAVYSAVPEKLSAATHQSKSQLKGEDDDYIDPPNVDWDIDGVLGLESGKGRSEISEKTKNDAITENGKQSKDAIKKDDSLKINKEGSEMPVLQGPISGETHGKICILRGKEKVCSPAVNSIPLAYTNQVSVEYISI
ncbi:hypothetical protein TYRP_010545, partial [Tyrophagus putrescentiae]